ncbi:hypothetical protein ACTXT7_009954, partial [Hymenolepis weldensis]
TNEGFFGDNGLLHRMKNLKANTPLGRGVTVMTRGTDALARMMSKLEVIRGK